MSSGHVQVAPDGSGKDIDADAVVSTESGNPTVYRQDIVVADPTNYGNKVVVDLMGQLSMRNETSLSVERAILHELRRIRHVLEEVADKAADEIDIDTEEEL